MFGDIFIDDYIVQLKDAQKQMLYFQSTKLYKTLDLCIVHSKVNM